MNNCVMQPFSQEAIEELNMTYMKLKMKEQSLINKKSIELDAQRTKSDIQVEEAEKLAKIRTNAIINRQSLTSEIKLNAEGFPLISRTRFEETPINTYLILGKPESFILYNRTDPSDKILFTEWKMNDGTVKYTSLHCSEWNGKGCKSALTKAAIKLNADRDREALAEKLLCFLIENAREYPIPACFGWNEDKDGFSYYKKQSVPSIWKEYMKKCLK